MEREDKQQKITRFKTDKLRQLEITREMERQRREKERQMHREQEKVIFTSVYTIYITPSLYMMLINQQQTNVMNTLIY